MTPHHDDRDDDIARTLEQLARPAPPHGPSRNQIRFALLSARPSSRIGFALVGLPLVFLCGVVLRYGFRLPVPGFDSMEEGLGWIERTSGLSLLSPLIFAGAPFVALLLNLLAIVHVRVARERRELDLTIKLRWMNLVVIGISSLIIAMVFVHLVSESAHRP